MVLLWISSAVYAAPTVWHKLAPGMDYTHISIDETDSANIQAFRFNPNLYKITLARAQDLGMNSANVASLALQNNALIAINGGFFDPTHNALGLRIKDGLQLNPLRRISWWGVFYTVGNRPYITSLQGFGGSKKVDFAIQSGPRLLVNGQIPPLKPGYDARSALAIDANGNIIIAVTENTALTTTDFARLLKTPAAQGGLNCVDALNLDGGSSSQLYAQVDKFRLTVPSFSYVSDAVIVVPR
jgi:uncharacterized protein YigE (DUF2233 family)